MTLRVMTTWLIWSSLWTVSLAFLSPLSFQTRSASSHRTIASRQRLYGFSEDPWSEGEASNNDDDGEDDDSDIDLSDQDWRSFRAKLVMSEDTTSQKTGAPATAVSSQEEEEEDNKSSDDDLDGIGALFAQDAVTTTSDRLNTMTPLDPSQWAYDSGKVIEQGAVILGGVEQDFGFGLRQQYFHKAAILVLDHEESTFTKGIILNRPTDLLLEDDVNPGVKWRVWFGGDVQGLTSLHPDIVCLHSLKNEQVTKASIPIMKDIQWTTFDNAKRLVKVGAAKPTDFWVFCGYAGWGPGQLMGELDRKSWYMVATDSGTLLKELARLGTGADPREAGLDTWDLLMNMIGRGETAEEYSGDFDDLMLKEWARKNLLSTAAGGGAGDKTREPKGLTVTPDLLKKDPVSELVSRVSSVAKGSDVVTEGTLVRATGMDRSPFLLDGQELHKSLVLIIGEDPHLTVGAILNRPSANGLDIQLTEKDSGKSKKLSLPLRFGGQYAVKGNEPLLWVHYKPALRAASIGSPFGDKKDGIWKCTSQDLITAVSQGLAKPEDFLVVSGVSVWTKADAPAGMQGEVDAGNFEIVPDSQTEAVWNALSKQQVLTSSNLVTNLALAEEAWVAGAPTKNGKTSRGKKEVSIAGLGENYDEEDDSVVFKSDVKVSKLSDDALRSWVATFLLSAPTLRG